MKARVTIILLLAAATCALALALTAHLHAHKCYDAGRSANKPTRWIPLAGCMIRHQDHWIPIDMFDHVKEHHPTGALL